MCTHLRHFFLIALFTLCCLLTTLEAASPPIDTSFEIAGNAKGGVYRQIRGSLPSGDLHLALDRKATLVNIGGLLVEGNPTFTVTGKLAEKTISLKIVPEDIIADVDGLKVQTGTIYHVTGAIAEATIEAEITESQTISDFGGLKVVTETWATFKSRNGQGPRFELRRVSVLADLGGFKVEQDLYNTCKGSDKAGKIDFTLRDWVSDEDTIKVSGTGSDESLALTLALRPFLNS